MKKRGLSLPTQGALLGTLVLIAVCALFAWLLSATVFPETPHTLETGGQSSLTDAKDGVSMLIKGTENGEYFAANYFPTLHGAAGDDTQDDTAALRSALEKAKLTGGTVYLPAGTYRLSEPLIIPAGVTLRGDFTSPDASRSHRTVFSVSDSASLREAPLFTLEDGANLIGITVYYEKQVPNAPVAYPVTIYNTGEARIERIALINPYHGICSTGQGEVQIESVWMSPMDYGILVTDNDLRVHIEDISVSPIYWLNSVPEVFAAQGSYAALTQHLAENLHGIILEQVRDVTINRFTLDNGGVGMLLNVPAERDAVLLISESKITAVTHPLVLESLPAKGACFSDCSFQPHSDVGATTVRIAATVQAPVLFSACSFVGSPKTVIAGNNSSFVSFYYCDFGTWWNSCFAMNDATFLAVSPEFHTAVDRAILGRNGFGILYGAEALAEATELLFSVTGDKALLSGTVSVKSLKDSGAISRPTTVISAADFGVAPHQADNSLALQAAFEALGEEGGIVFLPEGEYHFVSPITVPSSVLLIGVGAEGTYKTSILFPSIRQDSEGLIRMEQGSALENLELKATDGDPRFALISSAQNIRLRRLTVSAGNGICLTDAKNATLEHLSVRASLVGIDLKNSTQVTLRSIELIDRSSSYALIGLRCENAKVTLSRIFSERLSYPVECFGTSELLGTLMTFRRVDRGIRVEEESHVTLTTLGLLGKDDVATYFLDMGGGRLTVQGLLCDGNATEGSILLSRGGIASLQAAIFSSATAVSVLSQGEDTVSLSGCIWNCAPTLHASATKGTVSLYGNLLQSDMVFEGIEGEYLLLSVEEGATIEKDTNVMKYLYVEAEEGGSESGSGEETKPGTESGPSLGGHEPK